MSTGRIEPGRRRDIGIFASAVAAVIGRYSGTEPPKLFRVLGKNRRLFKGWLHFAGRLMPGGSLPRRETELVILRVAHLTGCDYEFAHHDRLGRTVGLTEGDIERVRQGPAEPGWSPRERAMIAAVDLLHHERDLDDRSWAALRAWLGEREVIELCLLTGHYEMLATVIATLRITPDKAVR
ncbi:carboxymuconolactone decarboxylase family protein [Saccharomonospora sp. NPDC006951]